MNTLLVNTSTTVTITIPKTEVAITAASFGVSIKDPSGKTTTYRDSDVTGFTLDSAPTATTDGTATYVTPLHTEEGLYRYKILKDEDSDNKVTTDIASFSVKAVVPATAISVRTIVMR